MNEHAREYLIQLTHHTTNRAATYMQEVGASTWRNNQVMASWGPLEDERCMGRGPHHNDFDPNDHAELCWNLVSVAPQTTLKPSGTAVSMGEIPPTFFQKRNRVQISEDKTEIMRTLQWDREITGYQPIGSFIYKQEDEIWAPSKSLNAIMEPSSRTTRLQSLLPRSSSMKSDGTSKTSSHRLHGIGQYVALSALFKTVQPFAKAWICMVTKRDVGLLLFG